MGFLTIKAAVDQGSRLLEDAQVSVPRLTAEVLLCHALGRERVYLYGHPEEELTEVAWTHYGRYLQQRLSGKPTQYITKRQEFFGREFTVSPDVLIPRPETEHLVAAAIDRLRPKDAVIDVGCGSGAIAVTIALEAFVRVFACDISGAALRIAVRNSSTHDATVRFVQADLLEAVAPRSLQMVVSNPPYVGLDESDGLQREVLEYEPHMALFAGHKGTEIYERIIAESARVLVPGGWLLVELGWKSLEPVRSMLGSDWSAMETIPDLAGIPRVLAARFTP